MHASREDVAQAARLLAGGGVVVFPTETVYGLGADAGNARAVERLFVIKGRPSERALIVHVCGSDAAQTFASVWPNEAQALADQFWPGPLTLVVPARPELPRVVTGGGNTVGLRAPAHPLAQALIARLSELQGRDAGIAAPSANRYGEPPPTSAAEARTALDDAPDFILDGGACTVGIPSTVVSLQGGIVNVLREGAISRVALDHALGRTI